MSSRRNNVSKPPLPKGPKPKKKNDDGMSDTSSNISYDEELSFERRPSFKEPVHTLIDTSKRTLKTLHHTLYLMKPRMLKTKMIEDIEDKYNEINELHFVLKHYKDEAAKALDVAKNCRVVVSKIMNKYLVEKSELQSCMKDLNYHYAKYENELYKLKSIENPINLVNIASKIVDKIPVKIIKEMQIAHNAVLEYESKSAKEKKQLDKDCYVPPYDPTTLYTKFMFDILHIIIKTNQLPLCRHDTIDIYNAELGKDLKSDFVQSIYYEIMENGWHDIDQEEEMEEDNKIEMKNAEERDNDDESKTHIDDAVSKHTSKHRKAIGLSTDIKRTDNQHKFLTSLSTSSNTGNNNGSINTTTSTIVKNNWTNQLKHILKEYSKPYEYITATLNAFHAKEDLTRLKFELKHHISKRKYLKKVPDMEKNIEKHRRMFAQFSTIVETIEKKRLDKSMFDLNEETRELIQPYIDLIEMLYKQDTDAGISVGDFDIEDFDSWEIDCEEEEDDADDLNENDEDNNSSEESSEESSSIDKKTVDLGQVLYKFVTGYLLKYQSILDNYTGTIKNIMKYRLQYEQAYTIHALQEKQFKQIKEKDRKAKLQLDQDLWIYNNFLEKIDQQIEIIKARGKYPIALRPVNGPDLLKRRGYEFCKYDDRNKIELKKFQELKKHMKHRNKYLSEIVKRHNICKNELMKAHDPHTWYGKNGKELWIDDKTHFEWYTKGTRCMARLKGWSKFFVGTIEDIKVASHRRRAECTIQFDDRDIAFGVNYADIKLLYPHKVSTERALENGETKYFLTTFIHAHEFPSSCAPAQNARMDHMMPLMLHAMQHQHALLEDNIQYYLMAESKFRTSASKIIQNTFRKFSMKKKLRRRIRSIYTFKARVRKSKIRYKFLKHREKIRIFCETYIPRQNASMEIQRVFRGYLGRISYKEKKEIARLEEIERQKKLEARRVEIEFARRMRAKKKQAEFVSNWRCPRCPIKVQYTQKFKSMAEIELHKMKHMSQDELKFSKHKAAHEAKELKRRQRLMEIKLKQQQMMVKLKKQTAEFVKQQEIQQKETANKRHMEKVALLNTRFTLKFQRPILSALKKKHDRHGIPVIYSQASPELQSKFIEPPYPVLKLVQDPRRQNSKTCYNGLMHRIDINSSPFRIGRGSQCDVRMNSNVNRGIISKVHCAFFSSFNRKLQKREIHIADLHSTNGTFLNAKRIRPGYDNKVIIKDGDLITFGGVKGGSKDGIVDIIPSELIYQVWYDSGYGGDSKLWQELYQAETPSR